MGTTKLISMNSPASAAVDAAVSRLVSVDTMNGRFRISLPVALCTGSLVDVSVWPEPGGSFMVTDDGSAHFEASSGMIGARIFNPVARAKSAAYGAAFDGHSMLFIRVSADKLRGAIIAMASLIKEVVDEVFERAARAKASATMAVLYDRVDRAFPGAKIEHDAEVFGASTADYHVDALVRTPSGLLVFDLFTGDANSIAATFTKLSDISRSDDPPHLIGVTAHPERIGPKLELITSVARVIQSDADVDVYQRAAA